MRRVRLIGTGRCAVFWAGALLILAGCQAARHVVHPMVVAVLPGTDQDRVFRELVEIKGEVAPSQWNFDMPHRLRPCCAFGTNLRVRIGYLPVAGFQLDNVVDANDLGRHKYNAGILSFDNDPANAFISSEKNGLVYTCRSGFIDTAHIRDYADWMAYLSGRFRVMMDGGGTIALPDEGGERYLHVAAVRPALIEEVGRTELSIRMAQWASVQLAVWHETATWNGWSSYGLFPETASAFSPEDLYSNMVGIMLASELIRRGLASNVDEYEAIMDVTIPEVLRRLGAAPRPVTRAALRVVDGLWWDSSRPLPDTAVVLRRNFEIGPVLHPWMVPLDDDRDPDSRTVRAFCARRNRRPLVLRYPTEIENEPLRYLVRLEIRPKGRLAWMVADRGPADPWISQDDFLALVARARHEQIGAFGHGSDRP